MSRITFLDYLLQLLVRNSCLDLLLTYLYCGEVAPLFSRIFNTFAYQFIAQQMLLVAELHDTGKASNPKFLHKTPFHLGWSYMSVSPVACRTGKIAPLYSENKCHNMDCTQKLQALFQHPHNWNQCHIALQLGGVLRPQQGTTIFITIVAIARRKQVISPAVAKTRAVIA